MCIVCVERRCVNRHEVHVRARERTKGVAQCRTQSRMGSIKAAILSRYLSFFYYM